MLLIHYAFSHSSPSWFGWALQLVNTATAQMHALTLPRKQILQLRSCNLMQVASPSISMQFHVRPKIPAMDHDSFCQTPHKAYVTTSLVSVSHTVGHFVTAWLQSCTKYPWHLTLASSQDICVPASSSLPALPTRAGFSGHLTVLNFLFITFLSQGTHIKCSLLKCHTSWSDICTFFQLFRLKDFCIAVLGNIIKGPQIKSTISVLLSWAAAAPKSMAFH